MTAVLSRSAILGGAVETTPGTPVVPVFFPPFDPGSLNVHETKPLLRDESVRNNDSILQGLYDGQRSGGIDWTCNLYPIESGHLFRSIIGPDTVTAAPSSTTLTGSTANAGTNTAAGTVALVPGSVIIVNQGNPTAETRYVVDATHVNQNWNNTHAAGESVTYLTKHTFQQGTGLLQPKTYTWTVYDGVQSLAYPYGRCSSLGVTIDTTGIVKLKPNYTTFFPQAAATPTYAGPTAQPQLGWQWIDYIGSTLATTNISTRSTNLDMTISREVDLIWGSDGTQDPREIFAAEMAVVGKKTSIYENTGSSTDVDWTNFRDVVQTSPFNCFVGSTSGSSALLVTNSKPGITTFGRSWGKKYLEASMDFDGIYNTTDQGQVTVTLWNTQTTQYGP